MSVCMDERRFSPTSRPMKDRDIDIFLSGHENNPLRRMIREKCEALAVRYRVRVAREMIPHEEYVDCLQRARLAVCIESSAAKPGASTKSPKPASSPS